MNKMASSLVTLVLATVTLSGCWAHYAREAHEEEFAERVAQKCADATKPTQVIVVPGTAQTVVAPAPAAAR
jgi:hypothetical protein